MIVLCLRSFMFSVRFKLWIRIIILQIHIRFSVMNGLLIWLSRQTIIILLFILIFQILIIRILKGVLNVRKHKIFCFLVGLCLSLFSLSQFNLLCEGMYVKAIDLPSGGHYMSATETRSYIGDSFDVVYWNGTDYVTVSATYDSAVTPEFSEVSESPVGYLGSGVVWLRYYASLTNVNTSPQYITVRLHPTYSIFDTNYIYTCLALSFDRSSYVSSATYDSPSSNWYVGGSVQNFYNSADSSANSGYQAYLQTSNLSWNHRRFTYVPIIHSSNSNFSTYCIDSTFNGNSRQGSTWSYAFLVMCPYVSGDASGGSGTFVTGGFSGGDINVTVNVDMSETNSLLGDILDGVAPISELVGLLSDDVDIPEAGTIVSLPYNNEDYDNMIMTADAILNDIPDTVAAAGFWVEITNSFFPQNSWLRVVMPLLMIMALMAWLLWKK